MPIFLIENFMVCFYNICAKINLQILFFHNLQEKSKRKKFLKKTLVFGWQTIWKPCHLDSFITKRFFMNANARKILNKDLNHYRLLKLVSSKFPYLEFW